MKILVIGANASIRSQTVERLREKGMKRRRHRRQCAMSASVLKLPETPAMPADI